MCSSLLPFSVRYLCPSITFSSWVQRRSLLRPRPQSPLPQVGSITMSLLPVITQVNIIALQDYTGKHTTPPCYQLETPRHRWWQQHTQGKGGAIITSPRWQQHTQGKGGAIITSLQVTATYTGKRRSHHNVMTRWQQHTQGKGGAIITSYTATSISHTGL